MPFNYRGRTLIGLHGLMFVLRKQIYLDSVMNFNAQLERTSIKIITLGVLLLLGVL